ncbi:VOC family protein [Amycolatopsis regifaucium]|uniref:Glyoxalase-like domain-containing protein n=1 Tax=Amycolatopsis regifaucium TaxID=546365 RepID=A0A154MSY6_9PSEU|nr:VOC family protein [Amycolatopsis regifaucium]KZB87406.1 hypothetical protein AVL48_22445 [Amycolatopsis regifaucium]OKA08241.1 hypothetical protein ATP06_0213205 [Amycolatopsis regifaucium]SFI44866.1 hypothetical protein SAMN04489731_110306 [Amycolatopsis regifaucium]
MALLRDVVFDCHHPASLARFWAAVLDGYEVATYDEEELDRLRSLGFSSLEDDPSVLVEAPTGPRLFFNLVPEGKVAKNRVHLDLTGDDVERLVALGAKVLTQPEDGLVVLADPEGNEFCLATPTPSA